MADRLAENGAIQYALANPEAGSKRAALSGYIMGALTDWLRSPFPPSSRLAAPGRLRGKFFDSGIAPLAMDFTSGQYASGSAGTMAMKSFSDIVTFSRTSNATITKSDGTIGYAPHNLLTYSEQFDNAAWVKGLNISVTANSTIAPNTTQTADTLNNSDASSIRRTTQSVSTISGLTYTLSIYVKLLSGSTANMSIGIDGTGGGTVAIVPTSDWTRFTYTLTSTFTGSVNVQIFQGASSSIAVWGAQLEIGSTATTYNPTTVKNLLGYTEAFDNAAWTKSNSFVQTNLLTYSEDFSNAAWVNGATTDASNTVIAPNGYQTADTLIEDSTNASHQLYQAKTITAGLVTFSVYAKQGSGTRYLAMYPQATSLAWAIFDLINGTTIATGQTGYVGSSITAVGDGWYRCSVTLNATGTSFVGFLNLTNSAFPAAGYQGDGTSSVYLWGAQLVQGSTAGDYRRTDAATLPVFYPNHNGVVCAEKLVDNTVNAAHSIQQSSNLITNTPYTVSCYGKKGELSYLWIRVNDTTANQWAWFNLNTGAVGTVNAGITASITNVGNGYYRCSVTRTSAGTGAGSFYIGVSNADNVTAYTGDGTSGIYIFGAQLSDSASLDPYVLNAAAAPSAQAYYGARFDYDPVTLAPKGLLIEEARTNLLLNSTIDGANLATQNVTVTAVAHTISFYGTGTITLSGTATATINGTGAYPTRTTLTFTPTAGTLTVTVSGTVQYAQLTTGSFATSFIPTAGSTVTRAADVAVIQGSNFYSWYNQNANSLYARFDTPASGNRNIIAVDDGSANNHVKLRTEGTDPYLRSSYVGTEMVALDLGAVAANTAYKIATGYSINNYAGVINAGTVGTDTTATTPLASVMRLGTDQAGAYLNGHLYSISSFNLNVPQSTLQGLTA